MPVISQPCNASQGLVVPQQLSCNSLCSNNKPHHISKSHAGHLPALQYLQGLVEHIILSLGMHVIFQSCNVSQELVVPPDLKIDALTTKPGHASPRHARDLAIPHMVL